MSDERFDHDLRSVLLDDAPRDVPVDRRAPDGGRRDREGGRASEGRKRHPVDLLRRRARPRRALDTLAGIRSQGPDGLLTGEIGLSAPWLEEREEELVLETLRSGRLSLGPMLERHGNPLLASGGLDGAEAMELEDVASELEVLFVVLNDQHQGAVALPYAAHADIGSGPAASGKPETESGLGSGGVINRGGDILTALA